LKKSSRSLFIIGLLVFVVGALISVNSFAADVDVYAEGAYTETDLAVYIYADINNLNILSAGVKLTYNSSELTVTSAEKNESVWFLGNESYMDPDISTVIICGKLDTSDEGVHVLDGVSGNRVLLGKVLFNRTENSMPFTPTLSIYYGKRGPEGKYKNFVATYGTVLDNEASGVAFVSITVRKRGDAKGNGDITMADAMFVKHMFQSGLPYVCYADANDDEKITQQFPLTTLPIIFYHIL